MGKLSIGGARMGGAIARGWDQPSSYRLSSRVQRHNGGTMRRYRLPDGAFVVVFSKPMREARYLPAFCNHVSQFITRREAAQLLIAAFPRRHVAA